MRPRTGPTLKMKSVNYERQEAQRVMIGSDVTGVRRSGCAEGKAMSMQHRAYAFDWSAFVAELLPTLVRALAADDGRPLADFNDANRSELSDPYEGDPLPEDWRALLESGDTQELADFALTRYYRPGDDHGVGSGWLAVIDALPPEAASALLGKPVGPEGCWFDPGRMGSYFQSPSEVADSSEILGVVDLPDIWEFRRLLADCVGKRLGVYVTF
jgi:hypothetical protein